MFEALIDAMPRPLRILDVGGTTSFWEQRGWTNRSDVQITLLNLGFHGKHHAHIAQLTGDATDLSRFRECSFDVVFSNSVIEHVFTLDNQRRMAEGIRRVAKAYWVQTPHFWFPIEPHFLVPGWHWLPLNIRVAMLRARKCGWHGPCQTVAQALDIITEVRLMTAREIRTLFPGARLIPERVGPFIKSWTAIGGFADYKAGNARFTSPA